jgi:hypothetical protein
MKPEVKVQIKRSLAAFAVLFPIAALGEWGLLYLMRRFNVRDPALRPFLPYLPFSVILPWVMYYAKLPEGRRLRRIGKGQCRVRI